MVLPGNIDEEGIQASLDEGVLTITVPKEQSEQQRSRKTQIQG